MNATLEAMARALFQSWFVDFDPVRRNLDFTRSRGERGEEEKKFQPASSPLRASASPRDPFDALAPATAALFPGSFQAAVSYVSNTSAKESRGFEWPASSLIPHAQHPVF